MPGFTLSPALELAQEKKSVELSEADRRCLRDVNDLLSLDRDRGLADVRRRVRAATGASWVRHIELHTILLSNSIGCLRYLLDEVKVKTVNSEISSYTPLQLAVVWGRNEAMVLLLARGADPMLNTSKSVVDQARGRQCGLQRAMARAIENEEGDGASIGRKHCRPLLEEGDIMLRVLEGVEAAGSFRDWAIANASHPLVQSTRPPAWREARYLCAVLRAMVATARAELLSEDEREAVKAQLALKAAAQAKETQPLQEALRELGFSDGAARQIWYNVGASTLADLRASRLSAEELESKLDDGTVRTMHITDRERCKFIRWFQEGSVGLLAADKPALKSHAKCWAAPAAKAALFAMPAKVSKGSPDVARSMSQANNKRRAVNVDGMSVMFGDRLPDQAFMLAALFAFGPAEA